MFNPLCHLICMEPGRPRPGLCGLRFTLMLRNESGRLQSRLNPCVMLKKIVAAGIILSCCAAARADYLSDRKAAIKLVSGGTNEAALVLFIKMAEGPFSDFQKADALEQAALCANRLKQYDRALELAKQIPLPAASKKCRMNLMRDNGKYAGLIAEFKDEKIDDWPESLVGDGLFSRGTAYYQLKDGKSAEADLKKAVEYIADEHTLGIAWLTLGNNYRGNLKDDQKALEAYAQPVKMMRDGSGYHYSLNAVLSSADILGKQGKYDEALQVLGKADIKKYTGGNLCLLLAAHADILAGQGRKAEAIAKLNEAVAVKDIPASYKEAYEKRLKALQSGAK